MCVLKTNNKKYKTGFRSFLFFCFGKQVEERWQFCKYIILLLSLTLQISQLKKFLK